METTNDVECLCFEFCLDSEKHPMGVQMICKPTANLPPSPLPCTTAFPWMRARQYETHPSFPWEQTGALDVERKAGDTVSNVEKQPEAPPQLITMHASLLSVGESVQTARASFPYVAPQGFMFGTI